MQVQDSTNVEHPLRKAIEEYEAKRLQQLADVTRTERMINELLQDLGEPAKYNTKESQAVQSGNTSGGRKKRSRYYGKPLATAVRMYLETLEQQPASADEILAELESGDFDFDGMGWKKEGRLRSLAMSLAKNTATFHRLPSGAFGLVEWYPNAKVRTKLKATPGSPAEAEDKPEGGDE